MKFAWHRCQAAEYRLGLICFRFMRWVSILVLTCALVLQVPAGDFVCQKCHVNESRSQPATSMAHALSRPMESDILKHHPRLQFASGAYSYEVRREANQVLYSVTGSDNAITVPVLWAFGLGAAGQTFVYEYRGAIYESRVSFYTAIKGLDITVGHKTIQLPPGDLTAAAGRPLQKMETSRCFGCHATTAGNEIKPGVQCDRCHQEAAKHVSAFVNGTPAVLPAKLSRLDSEEMSGFCGQCHRTWEEIAANGPHDVNNVRFQPYRLASSKCYESSPLDKRIRCVACHDPHKEVIRDSSFYDAKCESCHASRQMHSQSKSCATAQRNCVTCHMPKIDLAEAHFGFTDHRIRVPLPNQRYPE
jgi:hypothetical protein